MENLEGSLTTKRGQYIYEAAKAVIELGYWIRIDKIYGNSQNLIYSISRLNKRHNETFKVLETLKVFDCFCTAPNWETLYQCAKTCQVLKT